MARNQKLLGTLHTLAAERNASAAQLAVAWVLAQGESIVPVIGARKRSQLEDSLAALNLQLSADELKRIADAIPASEVAGSRYDEHQMKMLDSEH